MAANADPITAIKVKADATALRVEHAGQTLRIDGTPAELRAILVDALAKLDRQTDAALWAAIAHDLSYPCN